MKRLSITIPIYTCDWLLICGGMLQWYYPSSPYVGDLKVNIGCYVNGNKVEAGEFLFQAVNFGSLSNYKYSISVVPWTKPETT